MPPLLLLLLALVDLLRQKGTKSGWPGKGYRRGPALNAAVLAERPGETFYRRRKCMVPLGPPLGAFANLQRCTQSRKRPTATGKEIKKKI